jgi:nitrogen fixation/metabolism regulation signal transduction histidine kinase
MKLFRPGLRTLILLLYLIVSIGSLILLNYFFQSQQLQLKQDIGHLELVEELRDITFHEHEDSLKANEIVSTFSQAKSSVLITLQKTQFWSAMILLGLIVVSSLIFIVVLSRISKPLRELKDATETIRKGDFSVHLPETGIYEMKMLKNSFNVMSRELEATQKRLLVAEKEMIWKDLSRILAHEIKNPLTPIQLAIQRLEERLGSDPGSACEILPQSIAVINQEIENLRLLAQDFSSFAKVNQPRQELFDPAEAIREICRSYITDYSIGLDLEAGHLIRFDRTHFYQVITNILQNAIDASEPGQEIGIGLSHEKSYLVISIRDQGGGIDPEDLHRIFEPYFSRKNKGTGLGLALVKKLCEANKAIVRVKSKPGEGSEFILIIEEARS